MASVIAIRHIDATFAELQRLQGVGDLAEEIDRRMDELRLAARDFVTDQGAQPDRVGGAAFRPDRASEEDPARTCARAAGHDRRRQRPAAELPRRIERVTALIARRAELVEALPQVREQFEAAISAVSDRATARALFRAQNQIAAALLAHDPDSAERAAQNMRAQPIDDPALRAAADAYAGAITAISSAEAEIAKLDKDVLGTEGRLIGRVTELLRELSARRGRVLSRDFARTLAETKWQSIVLGAAGVLIGFSRHCSWSAAPSTRWRRSQPRSGAGRRREACLDPLDRRGQRDRRDRPAPPKCSVAPWSMPTRRAKRRFTRWPSSGSPRKAIASCSKVRSTAST